MKERPLRHRSPLLWIALPMTAGLVMGRLGCAPPSGVALVAAAALAAFSWNAARVGRRGWALTLVGAMVLAGAGAYRIHRDRLPDWETLPAREVRLTVRCDRIFPSKSEDRISAVATVLRADAHLTEIAGQRIYLALDRGRRVQRPIAGSRLRVMGVLERIPFSGTPYSFEGYLSDLGVNFRLSRGQAVAQEGQPGVYRRFCANAAERFHDILGIGVEEERRDLAGILRAMMLGQTSEMTAGQTLLFMQSGTLHLFAISGLHIVAIALAIHGMLAACRLPRPVRFLVGMVALWLYVDITGGAPSAVRAWVMVVLVELALLVRRAINPLSTLTFAWVLVLVFVPLQLFTASFQMSYGIVASLLLVGVPLFESIRAALNPGEGLPLAQVGWIRRTSVAAGEHALSALSLGAAASLVGLISGVAFFRLLTPGAMLVNLVMIPVSTLVIYAGFASLVVGMAGLDTLASVFNHAGALVVLGMEACIRWALGLPGMFVKGEFRWSGVAGGALAAMLLLCLVCYARPGPNRWLRWIPPFALCAVLLAVAVRYG